MFSVVAARPLRSVSKTLGRVAVEEGHWAVIVPDQCLEVLVFHHHIRQPSVGLLNEREVAPHTPLRRRLIDHPDITVQFFGIHTEHLTCFFCSENKRAGAVFCPMADDTTPALFSVGSINPFAVPGSGPAPTGSADPGRCTRFLFWPPEWLFAACSPAPGLHRTNAPRRGTIL